MSIRTGRCSPASASRRGSTPAIAAPGAIRSSPRSRWRANEHRPRIEHCSRRPSRNHGRGADGDLHAGGQHFAAERGAAAYPGHALDGRRRGRLGVFLLYRRERRRHADGALARGALWPQGGLSVLPGRLRVRPDPRHAGDDSGAVRARPDRPGRRERPACAAIAGDPARCDCRRRAMRGSAWRGRCASCSASAAARASAAGSANITAGARSSISACR